MNILVIGCDQGGEALIRDVERLGHDISVVEKDPEQLKRLDAFDDYTFHGTALVGDPTDPDTLRRKMEWADFIYVGGGKFVHASTYGSGGVLLTALNGNPYYSAHYIVARRMG